MNTFVMYGAKWCGACHAMAPMVEAVAADAGVGYIYYDAEEHIEQANDDGIYSLPTIILERDGVEIARGGSMSRDGLMQMLRSA